MTGPAAALSPRAVATVTLPGPMPGKLAAAAAAGFTGIEACQADLDAAGLSPSGAARMARQAGLAVYAWQPLRDFEAAPAALVGENLIRARRAITAAALLGARTLIVCSSTHPQAVPDDRRAAGQLAALADLAARAGVRVAYEALSWGRHVRSWHHAWRIIEESGHPNLGICLDSFHILAGRDGLAGLSGLPAWRIFAVQLADAPEMNIPLIDWSRHHRCFPGQGRLDVTTFTRAVLAAGYDGPWSLEIFSDRLRAASPVTAAAEGMAALGRLERGVTRHPAATS